MTKQLKSNKHIARPVAAAAVATVLAAVAVLTMVLRGDGSDSGRAQAGEEVPAPGETSVCLRQGLDAAVVAELSSRSMSAAAGDGNGAVDIAPDEARTILAFEAKVPFAPEGWTARSEIFPESPEVGLAGYCYFRTFLTDPSTTKTFSFPEEPVTDAETGEVRTAPAHDIVVTRGAEIEVRPAVVEFSPFMEVPPGDGRTITRIKVNGQEAELFVRDYDEPSAVISWAEGGVFVRVGCALMTAEECVALAETIE